MKASRMIGVVFPENEIKFGMDMRFWQNVPTDVVLYPTEYSVGWVTFRGDGYGILKDDEYGLEGAYGNGSLSIPYDSLPIAIQKAVYPMFKEAIDREAFQKECTKLKDQFSKLLETNYDAARELLNSIQSAQGSVATKDAQN